MDKKGLLVNIGVALVSAGLGTAFTFNAAAATQGAKIAELERKMDKKAETAAIVELATKSDVRALGELFRGELKLQEMRDGEQDRRITTTENIQIKQGETLSAVDKKVDVIIAILGEMRKTPAKP